MGTVFKQTTTKPVPKGAELVLIKGKKSARWQSRGRATTAPLSEDGSRIAIDSAKWYGTVNGKKVPLCRDKQAAERMLTKLESDSQLAAIGLADPFARSKRTPIPNHLNDYESHLTAKGNTEEHVRLSVARVRAIFKECGFRTVADLDPGRVHEWLAAKRCDKPQSLLPKGDEFSPAIVALLLGVSGQAVRSIVKRHGLTATGNGRDRRYQRAAVERLIALQGRGVGSETINHYMRAVRGFMKWMVRTKRTGTNPLDTLTLLNAQTDIRRHRRELTEQELRALLAATRAAKRAFRGLSGEDRFHLYLLAATTGFRANALAHLTRDDFALDGEMPRVTLAARLNKSRKT